MNRAASIAIVLALVAGVAVLLLIKAQQSAPDPPADPVAETSDAVPVEFLDELPAEAEAASAAHTAAREPGLPRLVDLGSDKCIPCRMMAPILEELQREYAGVFEVEVIDVRADREMARIYGIRLIPTQIFYDADGRELFRHEGYLSKEDILARWKALGVELWNPSSQR